MNRRSDKRVSDRALELAVQRFDFSSFLVENGADVYLQGTQLAGICPFCYHHRTSFYVDPGTGLYLCHACGASGNGVKLVAEVGGLSFAEAIETLTEGSLYYDDSPPSVQEAAQSGPVVSGLPTDFEHLVLPATTGTERFWRYAKKRHLTSRLIQKYEVGFCRYGRYAGRLIVPVHWEGQVVTFVARDITDKKAVKIDTPPENTQKKYLFNLNNLLGQTCVVLTEGVFDAMMLPSMAVASFGKSVSDDQVVLLNGAGVSELWLCLDEDAAEENLKLADRLSAVFDVKIINLPAGKDPNKLGPEAMREVVKAAHVPSTKERLSQILR